MNNEQAQRFLAKSAATFASGKDGHLIVTVNGNHAALSRVK
jgi:hypothetical protein